MAEQTVRYRVELDQMDFAAQLEQVRSQIDDALTQSTRFAPGGGVEFTQIPSAFASSPAGFAGMGMAAGGTGESSLSEAIRQGFVKAQEDITRGVGSLRSGFAPGAAIAGPSITIDPQLLNSTAAQRALPMGTIESIGAFLGLGYDRRLPVSRTEYIASANSQLAQGISNLATSDFALGIGATAAMYAGGLTFAASAAIAAPISAAVLGARVLGRRELQAESLGEDFASQLGLTTSQGGTLAADLQAEILSVGGRRRGLSMDEAIEQIDMFQQFGGFDSAFTAEEISSRAKSVVNQVNQVAQTLGMTMDEALQVMAQLEDRLGQSLSDATGFASRLKAASNTSGLSTGFLINAGAQGVAAFQGTLTNPEFGYQLGIDSYVSAGQIARQSPMGADLARRLGGVEALGQSLMQNAMQFNQSSLGLLLSAARQEGFSPLEGFNSLLTSAATNLNSPEAIMTARVRQELNPADLFTVQATQLGLTVDFLNMTNMDYTDKPELLIGTLAQLHGISNAQSLAVLNSLDRTSSQLINQRQRGFFQEAIDITNTQQVGLWASVTAPIIQGFGNITTNPSVGLSMVLGRRAISHRVREALDTARGITRAESLNLTSNSSNFLQESLAAITDEDLSIAREDLLKNPDVRARFDYFESVLTGFDEAIEDVKTSNPWFVRITERGRARQVEGLEQQREELRADRDSWLNAQALESILNQAVGVEVGDTFKDIQIQDRAKVKRILRGSTNAAAALSLLSDIAGSDKLQDVIKTGGLASARRLSDIASLQNLGPSFEGYAEIAEQFFDGDIKMAVSALGFENLGVVVRSRGRLSEEGKDALDIAMANLRNSANTEEQDANLRAIREIFEAAGLHDFEYNPQTTESAVQDIARTVRTVFDPDTQALRTRASWRSSNHSARGSSNNGGPNE